MIRGKMTKLGFLAALATVSVATTIPATSGARAADLNTLMATCANCHGKDGASTDPSVPVIGGMSSAYAAENLAAYKSKTRPCPPNRSEVRRQEGNQNGYVRGRQRSSATPISPRSPTLCRSSHSFLRSRRSILRS